jgi:hypothetical protein
LRDELRPNSRRRHADHFQGSADESLANCDGFTGMNFPRRLYWPVVDFDATSLDRRSRQSAASKKPHGPEPLVDPCGAAGRVSV